MRILFNLSFYFWHFKLALLVAALSLFWDLYCFRVEELSKVMRLFIIYLFSHSFSFTVFLYRFGLSLLSIFKLCSLIIFKGVEWIGDLDLQLIGRVRSFRVFLEESSLLAEDIAVLGLVLSVKEHFLLTALRCFSISHPSIKNLVSVLSLCFSILLISFCNFFLRLRKKQFLLVFFTLFSSCSYIIFRLIALNS